MRLQEEEDRQATAMLQQEEQREGGGGGGGRSQAVSQRPNQGPSSQQRHASRERESRERNKKSSDVSLQFRESNVSEML